jgi:hypothetical protein
MSNLKKRFPFYSKLIRLYPATYRRQYGPQILQTFADMMDEPGLSRTARIKLRTHAYTDITKSIVRQWHLKNNRNLLRNPRRYIVKRLIVIAVLITPLLASIVVSAVRPQYIAQPGIYSHIFDSSFGILLWLELLPLLATLVAIAILFSWVATRHERMLQKQQKRRQTPWVLLTTISLIALLGTLFVGFFATNHYNERRRFNNQKAASLASQQSNPTLACTLLPLNSAQDILGPKTFMNNTVMNPNGQMNYSGVINISKDNRVSNCMYFTDARVFSMTTGFYVIVTEYLSSAEQARAKQNDAEFIAAAGANDPTTTPVTFRGYKGYIMVTPTQGSTGSAQTTASISLYVHNKQLSVSGGSLSAVYQAMNIMLQNVNKPTAKPAAITPSEEATITNLVMNENVTIAAGTEFSVSHLNRSGDTVSGTFTYSNGQSGTFSVKEKNQVWRITSYKQN